MTASAPCSIVSLILSCFNSLREICSDTCSPEGSGTCHRSIRCCIRRIRRVPRMLGGFTFALKTLPAPSQGPRVVLILKDADGVHSLWRGAFAERGPAWRPCESAVQMLEVWKNNDRGNQTAHGFHSGDVSTSFVCKGECHELEFEFAAPRSRNSTAGESQGGSQHPD